MSNTLHERRFPNETQAYRSARDALLESEIALRRSIEAVAAQRRALPVGGEVREDYTFEEGDPPHKVRLSQLFGNRETLIAYSFMYGPDMESACPMCTAMLDGLNGNMPHVAQRANLVVIGKSPIARLLEYARRRGWGNFRLVSSAGTTYNRDYFGENPQGQQIPCLNVFVRRGGKIRHWYATEMLFAQSDPGQNNRHVDLIWPLWNLLDLTPEGRGKDWYPKIDYAARS